MAVELLDYIVVKPVRLHVTAEEAELIGLHVEELDDWPTDEDGAPMPDGETVVPHGARIPGHVAEGWGDGGRVVNHLVANGILGPVPSTSMAAVAAAQQEPDEPQEPVLSIDEALELAELREKVAELQAERDVLAEKLTEAEAAPSEDVQVVGDVAVLEWDSPEYLERWDALDGAELAAEIVTWGTGDGTDESPAVMKPSAELIEGLAAHEAAHGNREDVLAALSVAALEVPETPATEETPDERPFPRHKAAGTFVLSNGEEVKGKREAVAAEAALAANTESA